MLTLYTKEQIHIRNISMVTTFPGLVYVYTKRHLRVAGVESWKNKNESEWNVYEKKRKELSSCRVDDINSRVENQRRSNSKDYF